MYEDYIGHDTQVSGVEEYRLVGGRGDGMRLLQVRNGLGLDFAVLPDRCADLGRFSFRGVNFSFLSVNGYVAPAYYDDQGKAWLKSFTGGMLTTCGLDTVGDPSSFEGERLPMHGEVSNTPAERIFWDCDGQDIVIDAAIPHSRPLGKKLSMRRRITCSKTENAVTVTDAIVNIGAAACPVMLLYHVNVGFPLLSESACLYIPSSRVWPRNARSAAGLARWADITPPLPGNGPECFFHELANEGRAGIFNPSLDMGLMLEFDTAMLDHFNEWKHLCIRDYVLGLEPSNCHLDGVKKTVEEGRLKTLNRGEQLTYSVTLRAVGGIAQWNSLIGNS